MTDPIAVQLSYRLGGSDGVAVEARKWEWALRELGFSVRRVAGELDDGLRPDDAWLPFLAIDPPDGAATDPGALGRGPRGRRPRRRREPLLAAPQPRRRRRSPRASCTPTTARSCSTTTTCRGNAPDSRSPPGIPPQRPRLAARDDQRPLARRAASTAGSTRSRSATPSTSTRRAATVIAHAPTSGSRADDLVLRPADPGDPTQERARRDRVRRRRSRHSPRLATSSSGSPARPRTATTTCSRGSSRESPVPVHVGRAAVGRRRVRRRRPRRVPVDVGGVRQPGDRVDRAPPTHRRRRLPGAPRAPRVRRATALGRRRRRSAGVAPRARIRPCSRPTSRRCARTAPSRTCPTRLDAALAAAGRTDGCSPGSRRRAPRHGSPAAVEAREARRLPAAHGRGRAVRDRARDRVPGWAWSPRPRSRSSLRASCSRSRS